MRRKATRRRTVCFDWQLGDTPTVMTGLGPAMTRKHDLRL